jgi:hypothetical protein
MKVRREVPAEKEAVEGAPLRAYTASESSCASVTAYTSAVSGTLYIRNMHAPCSKCCPLRCYVPVHAREAVGQI